MSPLSVNTAHQALPPLPPMPGEEAAKPGYAPFVDLLTNQIHDVNELQTDANSSVHELLTGGDVNSAEVFTAVQKADMAFRLMQQIRNKLVDAYREINQMQI